MHINTIKFHIQHIENKENISSRIPEFKRPWDQNADNISVRIRNTNFVRKRINNIIYELFKEPW